MEQREVFSVSQINAYAKNLLENQPELQNIWVEGEISNYRRQYSGHLYFSLKDEKSSIRCVMFSSRAKFLPFEPENDMKVMVKASVSIYERDGQFQLYLNRMEPLGVGSLALAFEQLRNRLSEEGLFDSDKKKLLPFLPKTVGVVTSPTGAAVHDIISVISRRNPGVNILLAPVLVQGPGAAEEIAKAIELFNREENVDVLIVGRGGGSLEELWAFNEEIVVRAIYASAIPIISAVGHETDFTLSDFTADIRAATPSAAAELAVPDLYILKEQIAQLSTSLNRGINTHLNRLQESLLYYQNKLEPEIFSSWLLSKQSSLNEKKTRLNHLMELAQHNRSSNLKSIVGRLEVLSPLKILSRGFAFCQNIQTKKIVTSVEDVILGDELSITFSDGQAIGRVLEIREEERN
ncbi:MAG: exodeoxyribonuclease VII large subunit [Firmicutes bacterium]|jgi:exodeoxyribonuclease VII large subunit|nr:exodeoxyribonuclease VII large subunit [Bacillota bacterium]